MKKLFTLLAIAFCLNAKAQTYAAIPDSNFVHYLKTIVQPAFKGDSLDTSSVLVTTTTHTIICNNANIGDLTGINYFKSLRYLDCSNNNNFSFQYLPALSDSLTYLNCSGNNFFYGFSFISPTLRYLNCAYCSNFNIATLPDSLRYLNCTSTLIAPPNSFPNLLDTIIADATGWSTIPSLPPHLVYLSLSADFIECFPPFPPSMRYVNISGNFFYCLPNYPMGLITNDYDPGEPSINYPLCGSNQNGCAVSPTCTSSVSYTLAADAAPNTWNVYPDYPANVDSIIWHWGDGTSSGGLYPSHTYSVAGKYNICVYAIDATNCEVSYCQYDSVYTVNVKNSATDIYQISGLNTQISIYPNPTNGNFSIETNATTKQTVQVYDVTGRLALTQSITGKTSIDAGSLPNDIYNISVISNEGVINKRLVITH